MWSHDYCTVCDKQCQPGSMYCSDSCRVNEQSTSSTVSYSSDSVYSTLYTTGRHHSIYSTSLAGDEGLFSPATTAAAAASTAPVEFRSPFSPTASPALTASSASPMSIQSNDFYSAQTPPLSPMLLSQYVKVPASQQQQQKQRQGSLEFANTSSNYKRWLSSVA